MPYVNMFHSFRRIFTAGEAAHDVFIGPDCAPVLVPRLPLTHPGSVKEAPIQC